MTGRAAAVEAVFGEDGRIEPRRFTWQGTWLDVEGVGRRWTEDAERCWNIMAAGGSVFELRLDLASLRWAVTRGPSGPRVA